ncbi:MAG: chorismate synthase [Candidatus Cloacimonetes bacterium]|nr:chorismate synthase [Candidatus Cloacimonadota bacterium]
MKGNHWDKICGFTAFGESYSPAVGVVIEDIQPGIEFPYQEIQEELNKRKPGRGEFISPRQEPDELVVLSGVFEGKTTGMPICMLVYNKDLRAEDYEVIKEVFRPGHADLTYFKKFKIYDYRGGGRASGRETIARVAASVLVNKILEPIKIDLYPVSIGEISTEIIDLDFAKNNDLCWPCPHTYIKLLDYLKTIKHSGNSSGGIVEVIIRGAPSGLGDPVFEKLDANLAKAILSIGGVKGIEFGAGFALSRMKGSEANDPILTLTDEDASDRSGGINGGISSGKLITFRFVVKPTPSIALPQQTIDKKGTPRILRLKGRFDTCLIPRVISVARAMIKLVLADALSYQKLIEQKPVDLDTLREAIDKVDEDILISLCRRDKIIAQIAGFKKEKGIAVHQPEREQNLIKNLLQKAELLNLEPRLIIEIWSKLIEHSRNKQ